MINISTNTKIDVLTTARDLIANEKNWSKHCPATELGRQCPPWSLQADAWNSFGAVEKVLIVRNEYWKLLDIVSELENHTSNCPLLNFDHTHSHSEVMELFNTLIIKLKK